MTPNYLITKNGESEYKILLPDSPSQAHLFAASELNSILEKGFGGTLDIVYGGTVTSAEKWISIGETPIADSVSVSFEELGSDGYVIKSVGDSYILKGYTERGTIFAV